MARVRESWSRVAAWLQSNAPESIVALGRPAAQEEVASAQAQLDRVKLPADYLELISLINGSPIQVVSSPDNDVNVAQLLPAFTLLPIQQLPQVVRTMNNLYAESTDPLLAGWWSTNWVPFATDGAGDFLIVDAGNGDTAGAVIRFRHDDFDRVVLASSLGEYLGTVADALTTGAALHHHWRPTVIQQTLVWQIETPAPSTGRAKPADTR